MRIPSVVSLIKEPAESSCGWEAKAEELKSMIKVAAKACN